MGVIGVSSYFKKEELYTTEKYSNITVLVDGSCLIYKLLNHNVTELYRQTFCGGDYSKFDKNIVECFKKLEQCNIIPIVVLDGATPEMKANAKLRRMESTIEIYQNFAERNGEFWHHLARIVFVSALERLKIKLIQAPYEADDILAFLSYRFEWPIFSNDSDFFFCRHPVLSLHDLVENDVVQEEIEDSEAAENTGNEFKHEYCIMIQTLNPTDIRHRFGISNEALLQLAPILIGNDFVPSLQDYFPKWRFFKNPPEVKDRGFYIKSILYWIGSIKSTDFDQVNTKIHQIINPKFSVQVVQFTNRMREFSFVHLYDFPSGTNPDQFIFTNRFNAWYQRSLNQLYSRKFEFEITPAITDRELNIILTKTDWQRPIPENFDKITGSAFTVGNILAENIYSCLLNEEEEVTLIETHVGSPDILEITKRKRFVYKSHKMDWNTLSGEDRIHKLLIMLEIFPQHIYSLEDLLEDKRDRMLVISMVSLRRETEIPRSFIEALLICLFIRQQLQTPEDKKYFASWLKDFEEMVDGRWDVNALHYYNQFQIVLSCLISLTRIMLLQSWNPSDRLHILDGTYIARLMEISNEESSRFLIDNLFKRFPNIRQLLEYILTSV